MIGIITDYRSWFLCTKSTDRGRPVLTWVDNYNRLSVIANP